MLTILLSLFSSFGEKFLPFLKTYWKPIAIIVLVVGTGWYVMHLRSVVSDQAATITHDQQIIKEAADANLVLRNQITANNKTIDQWSQVSQQQTQQMATLQSQLTKQQADTKSKIANILTGVKPQTCDAAIDYLIQAGSEFKK